ncbi:MAG TPA: hypothetical protein VGJ91_17695 [Polyangiaceae bacterium]
MSSGVRLALAMLAGFGLLGWGAGCSVVVDANRPQCSTDADCTNRGAEFAGSVCKAGLCEADPQWSCPAVAPAHSYKLTMHLQDAVSMKPLPGVAAHLCRKLDVNCQNPIAGSDVVADDGGVVTLSIDSGFDGYVELTDSKISPSLYFFSTPASGDLDLPTVPLASPGAATLIVKSAGGPSTTWLADHGIVLLNAFDCEGQPAANITFDIGGAPDPATFIFYLVNTLPTTATTITDATGYGGLVNVPVGTSTISALLAPSGREIGNISILVRAGYISYSSVTPNSM